jgi:cell wall assembly regulator SMI1
MPEDPGRFQRLLTRLETWLAKHRPRFLAGLNPGASAAELKTFEKELGRPVPAALWLLLAWHNGQREDFIGKFEEDWQLMKADSVAAAKRELDAEPAAAGWKRSWVPFLENDAGDYLFVDDQGKVGEFLLGNKEHPVVAESLQQWLTAFVDAVEKGHYREEEERGRFMRSGHVG